MIRKTILLSLLLTTAAISKDIDKAKLAPRMMELGQEFGITPVTVVGTDDGLQFVFAGKDTHLTVEDFVIKVPINATDKEVAIAIKASKFAAETEEAAIRKRFLDQEKEESSKGLHLHPKES